MQVTWNVAGPAKFIIAIRLLLHGGIAVGVAIMDAESPLVS